MCIVEAAIGGAGAIAGGLIGAGGAKSAAKAQSKAAGKAADVSQEQYYQTREDQMPFLEAGYGALARQNELLGLGPQFDQSFNNFNAGAYLNANPDAKAWVAQHANKSGSNAEQLAYDHWVADGSRRQGDFWRNQTPSADYGKYARDFSMKDFTTDPGYAFRMSEGLKSLDRQAAARGGLISGGALKAATRYGQEMGSQEYTNAFNRYQAERQARLGPLQALTGMSQTTANTLGTAGQNMATNVGEAYQGGANARASGYVGGANALTSGLGTYLNYTSNQALTNRLDTMGQYTPGSYNFRGPMQQQQ